jgi:CRP-like cAMP-binding protein
MYLIARGECMVNIKDENNKVIRGHKILQVSDYFGEISMIYGCKRTATVVSRKYTTLAILSKPKFLMITTEFPKFKDILKRGIFKYNDKMKRFMKQCLRKIEYF